MAQGPIRNASDTLLSQNVGTLPNMSEALADYQQPMLFTKVAKTVSGYQNVEDGVAIRFMGVWQPFSARQLSMKPVGERAWKWFMLHAEPNVILQPDEVVIYQGTQYRVMEDNDYVVNGFLEYHLVQDFTGSGPT